MAFGDHHPAREPTGQRRPGVVGVSCPNNLPSWPNTQAPSSDRHSATPILPTTMGELLHHALQGVGWGQSAESGTNIATMLRHGTEQTPGLTARIK